MMTTTNNNKNNNNKNNSKGMTKTKTKAKIHAKTEDEATLTETIRQQSNEIIMLKQKVKDLEEKIKRLISNKKAPGDTDTNTSTNTFDFKKGLFLK